MSNNIGRPANDEFEDSVDATEQSRDTEELDSMYDDPRWMDGLTFVLTIAEWEVNNRYLSYEEIFATRLAWNLTHPKEEILGDLFVNTIEGIKALYGKPLVLNKIDSVSNKIVNSSPPDSSE